MKRSLLLLAAAVALAGCTTPLTPSGNVAAEPSVDPVEAGGEEQPPACEDKAPTITAPTLSVADIRFSGTNVVTVSLTSHVNDVTLEKVSIHSDGETYSKKVSKPLGLGETVSVTVTTSGQNGPAFSSGECAAAELSVKFNRDPLGGATLTAEGILQGRMP
ncbi:MAG: hypothetical protein SVS85_03760 [Candidatus Nanohaloarchaea archaeon]|nr:hypothetical protein [Candidatus Nanohaloarchaea archaeon]